MVEIQTELRGAPVDIARSPGQGIASNSEPLPKVQIKKYTCGTEIPYIRDSDTAISRGASGIVWKAAKPSNTGILGAISSLLWGPTKPKEFYAVKQLVKTQSYTEEGQKEAALLKLCAHENVLRLIEVYEVDTINLKGTNIVHIVVEPWAPDSIGTFLKMVRAERADRYFSWYRHESINEIISGICQQLGDGLEFLHSHEIKHGDINIENILLYTPPGDDIKVVPIISDLGSGTIDEIGDPTMANFSNGAPPYRSPELLQRLARALSADVFAMGVCFLYLYAAARDSHQAVAKIDTVIRESQTKMFGSEIPKILNLLNEDGFRPAEDSWLQKLLAWVTRYMLAGEPFERMEARQIRRMLRRHGPTLFNEMPNVENGQPCDGRIRKAQVSLDGRKWIETIASIGTENEPQVGKISTSCVRLIDPEWKPKFPNVDPEALSWVRWRISEQVIGGRTVRVGSKVTEHWNTQTLGFMELEVKILEPSPKALEKLKFLIQPEWSCPFGIFIPQQHLEE